MIARLIDAIGRLLKEQLSDFRLEDPKADGLASPAVYIGGLPKGIGNEEVFPCIVVSWEGASDTEEESIVEVDIALCLMSEDGPQGVEAWAAVFADRLRRILRETRVLEEIFERQWPVRTRRPDHRKEQYRYAAVVLSTTWRRPAPQQPVEGFEI